MLELYHSINSVCAQKVRIALKEKGQEAKDHIMTLRGDQYEPAYLELNPNGVVPTLIHDGEPITESSLILYYIDDALPGAPLMPKQPRQRYRVYAIAGKWLELLKQIAPNVTRMAVLRDPATSTGTGQFGAIQSVAPSLGVEVNPVNVRDAAESERAVKAFARSSNGGLIITASGLAIIHRDLIVKLAGQHRLPAIYFDRPFVIAGGLMSYGPDQVDQFRQAAGYVDRILKGEKPADLPVQAPTKYQIVLNLKTAKALGLDVPATLLARADEVIE